mgnify:CR=1 FL=1
MKKRFLSLLLALVLCIGLLPMAANAEVAKQPAIQSTLWDNSGSANGAKTYSPGDGYHYVYFGQWKGEPIKWRVLAYPEPTYDGTGGFLLMVDEIVDVVWFGRSDTDYRWIGSQAREWCDVTFYNGAFSALEQARIAAAPATRDRGIVRGREEIRNTPDNITSGPLYQEYINILNGDHIFFPSWLDLFNTAYGFAPDGTNTSLPAARQTRKVASYNYGNTKVWSYWLRSYTFDGDYHYAGMINHEGAYAEQVPDAPSGARPMLYLNTARNKIFFASAAAGGKSANGMDDGLTAVPSLAVDEWKLTLVDDSRDSSFQITGAYSSSDYLYLDYTGAQTGENEYISGHISDRGLTHYGRLAKVTDGSGTVKIAKSSIPDGFLYVYNEQYNGDYRTDYAGGVRPIDLYNTTPAYDVTYALSNILSSNTAPYVAKDTAYTTTLSVTDANQYMLPADIAVTVGGTALTAGTDYTYNAAKGELTVFAENITGALTIAAEAVKKTWKIRVSPEDIDFGTADYGYDEITAKTVTIQNTGNQSLTLETPVLAPVTDFEMTLGSAFGANGQAVLAPNESATVTVRPKAGLGVGRSYSDILEINDNTGKASEAVFLDFAVQETIVNIRDIHGVTVPVTGETPVTTITETDQYTGTVTWSPSDAAFAAGTQYTATVTLMPKDGYKLDGVPENFFTVDGAVCTNAAGSGVITAEFPALPSNSRQTHPVTIEQGKHGRLTVNRPSAPAGVTVTITASPDDGYELGDLTVVGRNGDEIDVKYEGDNQYSFRMPVGGVTIRAEFTPRGQYGSFGDVARGDYFFDAVEWAAEQGIMDGVGGGLFAPHSACTRAQLVTILYRLEGSPAASANPFNDVARGSYYEKAVAWAAEYGIVNGYGDGLFGPNDRITREQLAAILHRYAQYKKLDVSVGEDTNILSYNDATSISDYAFPAMQWACGAGLLKGANGDLLPKNTATRAQTATILYRLASLLK